MPEPSELFGNYFVSMVQKHTANDYIELDGPGDKLPTLRLHLVATKTSFNRQYVDCSIRVCRYTPYFCSV